MKRTLFLSCVVALVALAGANTPTESVHVASHDNSSLGPGDPFGDHSGLVSKSDLHGHGFSADGIHGLSSEGGRGGENKRYPVATIDFERVQTPFIIGLWIFIACLCKIGKLMTYYESLEKVNKSPSAGGKVFYYDFFFLGGWFYCRG